MRLLIIFSECLSNVIISSPFLCSSVDLGVLQMLINDLFRCVVLLMCRFLPIRWCLWCFSVKQIALIHRGSRINLSTSILSLRENLKFLSYFIIIFTCYGNWFDNHIDKVSCSHGIYHNIKTIFSSLLGQLKHRDWEELLWFSQFCTLSWRAPVLIKLASCLTKIEDEMILNVKIVSIEFQLNSL